MTPEEFPPIHSQHAVVLDWVGPRWAGHLRYAVHLSEQSLAPGETELRDLWPDGAGLCWLGGPAVGPGPWPRNAEGAPLSHVLTLDLRTVAGASDHQGKAVWPAGRLREVLPVSGHLQVFHDLQTYGGDPEDGDRAGWAVTWTPEAEDGLRSALVEAPDDDGAPDPVCQLVLPYAGFTLPSSLDVAVTDPRDADRLEELDDALREAWTVQRGLDPAWPIPTSHVYGHGWTGDALAGGEILPEVLPLEEGDEHRLVLDVESWTTLQGWFGDAGHLEVWMRQSDLERGAFDRAWCLIRTD